MLRGTMLNWAGQSAGNQRPAGKSIPTVARLKNVVISRRQAGNPIRVFPSLQVTPRIHRIHYLAASPTHVISRLHGHSEPRAGFRCLAGNSRPLRLEFLLSFISIENSRQASIFPYFLLVVDRESHGILGVDMLSGCKIGPGIVPCGRIASPDQGTGNPRCFDRSGLLPRV